MREVHRRVKELNMVKQLGLSTAQTAGGYLPLGPPPDEVRIAEAVRRLQDPETRLVDEFFWFWPEQIHGTEDAALKALAQGQMDEAFDLWLKQEREGSEAKVSTHNLAVLYHAVVLDWENLAATGRALTDAERDKCAGWWKEAFKRGQRLLNDTWFWNRLNARIRQLDDPRLTTGTARRLREALPNALLLVNARLAVRAAEKGDAPEVHRHLEAMRTSGFDTGLVNETLREVLEPTRERIEMVCSFVDARAEEDATYANRTARQFLEDIWPLLATIDRLLPKDHPLRDSVCGDAAGVVRGCIVAYGNATADWKDCLTLTAAALSLGVGQRARANLESDIRFVFSMLCSEVASEAEANPKAASHLAEQVLDDFLPLIEPLDRLLPQGHPVRQGLHDDMALAARHCVVTYGNATKDWKPCLHLTERILTLPIAPSVRERIEGDVKSLRDNINAAQCFFCKRNSADEAASVVVNVYGDVSETRTLSGTKVNWRQVPVRVPRCPLCKAAHRRASGWPWAGGGIGAVAGLMVGAAVGAAGGAAGKSSDSVCCGVLVGVVVLGAIGLAVGSAVGKSQLPAGVAPANRASGYSAVKELEGQGWHVGDKPPGVS